MKIGIIGSGRIVRWLLDDLKFNKYKNDIQLEAIFSTNLVTANEKANKYNIKNVYEDLNEFLKGDYDLVYVGTPSKTHYSLTKIALENNFNVYCEKPLAYSFKEAKELYDIANSHSRLLFDGIKTGLSPAYKKAKEIIGRGDIGDILLIHSTHNKVSTSLRIPDPEPGEKSGGAHTDGGMYSLFPALDIGGEIINYDFKTNTFERNEGIATSVILARHKNNCLSTVTTTASTTNNLTSLVQGGKGYLVLGGNLEKYNESYKKDSCHMAHTLNHYDLANNLIESYDFNFKTDGEGLVFVLEHVYELLMDKKLESNIVSRKISLDIIKILEETNRYKN